MVHSMYKVKEKALIDSGVISGMSGHYRIVIEGSERVVDIIGLAGQNVSHIQISTAPLLISTHKGDDSGTFQRMVLLG
jgi:hypothetical protein